jgi:hypothetical protein
VGSGKSQIPKHASTLITSWDSHLDGVVLGEGGDKLAKKGRVEQRGHLSTATGPAQQPPASSKHAAFCRVCGEHYVGLQLTEHSDTSLLVGEIR